MSTAACTVFSATLQLAVITHRLAAHEDDFSSWWQVLAALLVRQDIRCAGNNTCSLLPGAVFAPPHKRIRSGHKNQVGDERATGRKGAIGYAALTFAKNLLGVLNRPNFGFVVEACLVGKLVPASGGSR